MPVKPGLSNNASRTALSGGQLIFKLNLYVGQKPVEQTYHRQEGIFTVLLVLFYFIFGIRLHFSLWEGLLVCRGVCFGPNVAELIAVMAL